MSKINLLNFDMTRMREFCQSIGEKPFRAQQLIKWIHSEFVTDFTQMTNLSKALRTKLAEVAEVIPPKLVFHHLSNDGTRKWLIKLSCGNNVETVFIPEKNRGTLCVSSQIGCALNCQFCATATMGFNRNLTVSEIIGQVWLAAKQLKDTNDSNRLSNVVMMGMGEPLLNYDNVVPAMRLMMDDNAYNLSKYRVTLSTSGVLPNLRKLAEDINVSLAVSLHAPNDELRTQLVPINKKYPIRELMEVCKNYYQKEPKRKITFEYVMLADVNDKPEHARQLIKILANVPAKINLIPFNPFKTARYKTSLATHIDRFRDILSKAGLITTVRKTRGDDISAACGQLVGQFKDRTKRSQKNQQLLNERVVA